jgi:hypothetical protein
MRAVVAGIAIYPLASQNLYTQLSGTLLELVGDGSAIRLLIIENEHALDAQVSHPHGASTTLLVVRDDHARVVAFACGIVLLRLVRIYAGLGQLEGGVRRADHRKAGLV